MADIEGNVTINCHGVDPKALARLNELLDLKDLLADKIKEAEIWAGKYQELLDRLESQADDSELAKRAESLIREGQFEDAGRLLDEIIERGEAAVRRTARNHFNRGSLFQLQYAPLKALPHFTVGLFVSMLPTAASLGAQDIPVTHENVPAATRPY